MGWWDRMFGSSKPRERALAPQDIALNATLSELRTVASELQETNRVFAERVERLKERPRVNTAGRRTRAT